MNTVYINDKISLNEQVFIEFIIFAHRHHNRYKLGVTFWYTMVGSVIVPFPQDRVMFRQQESGTVFPPGAKYLQSDELFTPQHFIWRVK